MQQIGNTSAGANKIQKTPLEGVHHVYMIDWDDNGIQKEVAVVMEAQDGTIFGILVETLHPIDRKRLQRYVTSIHADKYQLWELLDQGKLSNGMNALEFFHPNYVKKKVPRGAISGGTYGTLARSLAEGATPTRGGNEQMIGASTSGAVSSAQPGEYR